MNNKEGFVVEANTVLSRYVGKISTQEVLENITTELNEVLNNYISDTPIYSKDFPIEFENWMGKWKIENDGKTQFQPRTDMKNITLNIRISKTGEIETINKEDNE